MLCSCDLFCALYNTSFKGFYFEGRFKPEVMHMQLSEGLTQMLDEVFDECLENMSELSVRAPQTNN